MKRLNPMPINRLKLQETMESRLGLPYGFGSKWKLDEKDPKSPIDCSGYSRWCWYQGAGITIPDGSYEQWKASRKLGPTEGVCVGDLGFFMNDKGEIHHVGLVLDQARVIEARGARLDAQGKDLGEHVIVRPRASWEAFEGFKKAGGWHRPLAVDVADGG